SLGGAHLWRRSDKSRTAVSPRVFTSAMIASTAARVFASASSCWPASAAVLMWRGMKFLLLDDFVCTPPPPTLPRLPGRKSAAPVAGGGGKGVATPHSL